MIAVLAAALAAAALPQGTATYRLELAGVHVGEATLAIRCGGPACAVAWSTRVRLPEEAGGGTAEAHVALETGPDGRSRGGETRTVRDGRERTVAGIAGAVPALVAPLVLLGRAEDGCLAAFEEETGVTGEACGNRAGAVLEARILGEPYRITPSEDGFPARLELPGQRARFVRASETALPDRPPRLFGVRVAGPPGAAGFCGLAPDAPAPPTARALPPPEGEGASCREITLDYLERAARRGIEGRVAVGVAWTGEALEWHAWAELRDGDGWVPVDPTFRQLPARGPRFTVARYAPDDGAARLEAGRRVLACWGGKAR